MFNSARQGATVRFNEVRALLECIKQQESSNPQVADNHDVLILRGLYYVHLYAAFEYAVNQSVQSFLKAVTSCRVKTAHLVPPLFSLALDPELSSLSNIGEKKKWQRRLDVFDRQNSHDECVLNDLVFGDHLQNVWLISLTQVFHCLNIPNPVVPDPRFGLFINEIVEKRNAVAHGRESPADVGRGTRSPDLQKRLDAITTVVQHIFDSYEQALSTYSFVAPQHRASYLVRATPSPL